MELEDTPDLGPGALWRAGSSPAFGMSLSGNEPALIRIITDRGICNNVAGLLITDRVKHCQLEFRHLSNMLEWRNGIRVYLKSRIL